jgi:Sigma-70, region 4
MTTTTVPPNSFWKINDVAKYLNITKIVVNFLVDFMELPSYRITQKVVFFDKADIEEWLLNQKQPVPQALTPEMKAILEKPCQTRTCTCGKSFKVGLRQTLKLCPTCHRKATRLIVENNKQGIFKRKRNPDIDKERLERYTPIYNKRMAGMKFKEISAEYGISRERIRQIIKIVENLKAAAFE